MAVFQTFLSKPVTVAKTIFASILTVIASFINASELGKTQDGPHSISVSVFFLFPLHMQGFSFSLMLPWLCYVRTHYCGSRLDLAQARMQALF